MSAELCCSALHLADPTPQVFYPKMDDKVRYKLFGIGLSPEAKKAKEAREAEAERAAKEAAVSLLVVLRLVYGRVCYFTVSCCSLALDMSSSLLLHCAESSQEGRQGRCGIKRLNGRVWKLSSAPKCPTQLRAQGLGRAAAVVTMTL